MIKNSIGFCLILVIIFVMAAPANAITLQEKGTSQGNIAGGQNLIVSMTRTELCAMYGLTPYQSQTNMRFYIFDKDYQPPFSMDSWTKRWYSDPTQYYPGDQVNLPLNVSGYEAGDYVIAGGSCSDVKEHSAGYWTYYPYPAVLPQTEVNFTGYPLDGYSPLAVTFTITNFTGINSTPGIWSFGDGQTGFANTSTTSHTYVNPGIYTVSLNYFNKSGVASTITKTNYILTSNSSGMIVNLDVKDAISGALIQDSTVSIRNTTNGAWRNTTAPTGLVYFSTTDPGYLYPLTQGQSITLAANKTGYRDASETFAIPYNNYRARLFLMPTTVINSTGTGTVVVNTIRNKDGLTISGISVVLDSGQMGITNTAGATTLYNVTAGTRYVTLTDPDKGYQDAKSTFNLSAGETKLVVLQMVRVGEQPVETPGSPTPTPTGTYDPDDPNSPVYGNYTTSQINEQGGAGVLGMLAQLIALWPLIVVGVLFKFMKSAFS